MKKEQVIASVLALQAFLLAGCSNKEHSVKVLDTHVTHVSYGKDIQKKPQKEQETSNKEDTKLELEYPIIKMQYGYLLQNCKAYLNLETEDYVELEQYQKVFIKKESKQFYTILLHDGKEGYVEKENINLLPDVYVEVDLSDQTLFFYKDNELLFETPVVTGKNSTPTRPGYFDIDYKKRDTHLLGPVLPNGKREWDSHVDYWMPFDAGRGFHDASWRTHFGGTIYQNSGSHGCVNMPYDAAKELYENVSTDTQVLIHK